jgi:hypothetical protein
MKKIITIVFGAFFLLVCSSAAGAACPSGSYSILSYGAVANDSSPDGKAFQNAVEDVPANAVLCFPSGVYLLDRQITVRRDDLTITGEGISSVLKMMDGVNVTMLKIGDGNVTPQVTSRRITVEKLAFDGNLHSGLTSGGENFFGIWIVRGEDIILRDLYLEEFFHDSITVSNGEVPNLDILIERVRVEKANRNAIHIGYGEDVIIRNCVLDKNQDEATWGLSSGNAIDVEVEGYDPATGEGGWVKRLTIEDTFMRHTNLNAAGAAVTLQPAYGPIDDVTVQRNLALEKGMGSAGANYYSAAGTLLHNTNIKFNSNWISIINSLAGVSGHLFKWTDYGEFNDNVITNYYNGNSHMMTILGATFITGYDNRFYRLVQVNNLYNAAFFVYTPYWQNQRVNFYNTTDNGWSDSKIIHYDPATGGIASAGTIGASSQVTWNNNSNSIPTNAPSITSAQITSGNLVVQTTEPNSLPVRVVALRNSLPIGMKGATGGTTTFVLPAPAVSGDVFEVRAYNQHGREATYTFTY